MTPSISCYPQPGKEKAQRVCEAFARGAHGQVSGILPQLAPGPAMFYGVRSAWEHLWREALEQRRDWYYADNAYFDVARERYFRVTRNALQHSGAGHSDGRRLAALGIRPRPWRQGGRHILLCTQSAEFMATVARSPDWLSDTRDALRRYTDRPVIVRTKSDPEPLREALKDCWAVVTWSSAAAVEALMAGVPVCCSPASAAWRFSSQLAAIESPGTPDGREAWAAVLADNQWTLDEIRSGLAWRNLSTRAGSGSTASRTEIEPSSSS